MIERFDSQQYLVDTKRRWPLGLTAAELVSDLRACSCPTKLGIKLDLLEKNNRLEAVLKFGQKTGQTALLTQFIRKGQFEFAKELTDRGAMKHYPSFLKNPYSLLLDKTNTQLRNPKKGGEKVKRSIYDLTRSMMNTGGSAGIIPGEVLSELKGSKHPILLAAFDHMSGEDYHQPEIRSFVVQNHQRPQLQASTEEEAIAVPELGTLQSAEHPSLGEQIGQLLAHGKRKLQLAQNTLI